MFPVTQYADKYFLRTKTILERLELNPWVLCRVFVRKGPGKVAGVSETLNFLGEFPERKNIKLWSLKDGDHYRPNDTIMEILAPAREIVDLETIYLGILTAAISRRAGVKDPDLGAVTTRVSIIKSLVKDRDLMYMGARHWHYEHDKEIAGAAFQGGASSCSTDIGASNIGSAGVGTIPHFLEAVLAYYHGMDNAVFAAAKAFDDAIEKGVPRIALVDFNNKEIDDALTCLKELPALDGIRVDTCGENRMQGAVRGKPFVGGRGVTISGVASLNRLIRGLRPDIKVVLSSGFADPDKVSAFVEAEKTEGKLFDSLGIGQVYDSLAATMDIVQVGGDPDHMENVSKVGRRRVVNENLARML